MSILTNFLRRKKKKDIYKNNPEDKTEKITSDTSYKVEIKTVKITKIKRK
jgi:hypothetical protein